MSAVLPEDAVALVTGSGRGLGRAIAEELLRRGRRVVLNDLTPRVQETATELGVPAVEADVSDPAQVAEMVARIRRDVGPIQILVNNAGVNDDNRLVDMTDDQWRKVLDVNLSAAFLCTRAVAPEMLELGAGKVVNLSSIGVLGSRNTANYAAAKAGVIGLTRTAALEFASRGVTVNAVAPGVMDTDMFRALPDKVTDRLRAAIPARRVGVPADVAAAVAFLTSSDASYITGQVLFVAGGIDLGYV